MAENRVDFSGILCFMKEKNERKIIKDESE